MLSGETSITQLDSPPVAEIWRASGLSQAELARRAGLPRSVLNAYVRGGRRPRTDVLMRVVAAAGLELRVAPRRPPVDTEEAGWKLVQLLEFAEMFPYRPRPALEFPGVPGPGGRSAQ